jgi:hypothetical protein
VRCQNKPVSQISPDTRQSIDKFVSQYQIALREEFHRLGMVIPETPALCAMVAMITMPELIVAHGEASVFLMSEQFVLRVERGGAPVSDTASTVIRFWPYQWRPRRADWANPLAVRRAKALP